MIFFGDTHFCLNFFLGHPVCIFLGTPIVYLFIYFLFFIFYFYFLTAPCIFDCVGHRGFCCTCCFRSRISVVKWTAVYLFIVIYLFIAFLCFDYLFIVFIDIIPL